MTGTGGGFARAVFRGVLAACAAAIVLVGGMEAADRAFFRRHAAVPRKVREFESRLATVEVLVLGPSDIETGIIPSALGVPGYNLAFTSETPLESYFKLRHYIGRLPRLRLVILPLTYATFSATMRGQISSFSLQNYVSLRDLPDLRRRYGVGIVARRLLSECQILEPRARRVFADNVARFASGLPISRLIYRDGHQKWWGSSVGEKYLDRRLPELFTAGTPLDEEALFFYRQTLELCAGRKIPVVTVGSPFTDLYLERAERYVPRQTLYREVVENPRYAPLVAKHLDYSRTYATRHELFKNANHLNLDGAVLFSRRLAADLEPLLHPGGPAGAAGDRGSAAAVR